MKIKRFINAVIGILLSLLGFQSCSLVGGIFGAAMYGSPHADFAVKGKVTDDTGKAVKGIKTVVDAYYGWTDDAGYSYTNLDYTDTLYTDSNGMVQCEATVFSKPTKLVVTLTDVDGAENGGEFEELVIDDFEINQVKKGDGSWYNGKYETEFNTRLEKKR